MMLQTLVAPDFKSDQAKTAWSDEVKEAWENYISKLLVYEIPKESQKDRALRDYYERVVSKMKPVVTKDKKTGRLSVTGIDPKLM
jgi:hypothetical protein